MLSELSIKTYLHNVASGQPVPGGGSVCALAAAAGAALAAMVAGLTVGREKFAAVDSQIKSLQEKATALQSGLIEDVDRDALAYRQVMEAFKISKKSEQNRKTRYGAIQAAFKTAAQVPLAVAEQAIAVMDLAKQVILLGNPNAATDGLVAAVLARSAVLGACYNVKINLESIDDAVFVRDTGKRAQQLEALARLKEDQILASHFKADTGAAPEDK